MSTVPHSVDVSTFPQDAWAAETPFVAPGVCSVEDYLALTDDSNRLIEYTEGRIDVLQMPTTSHQQILAFLYFAMRSFVKQRNLGEILFAALRVRLSAEKFREPDIVYVAHGSRAQVKERYWEGADLVVEIVSSDAKSRRRDHVVKRADYAQAGVLEYWIVDPAKQTIDVLALDGSEYRVAGEYAHGQQASSVLLNGFSVDVAGVFDSAKTG